MARSPVRSPRSTAGHDPEILDGAAVATGSTSTRGIPRRRRGEPGMKVVLTRTTVATSVRRAMSVDVAQYARKHLRASRLEFAMKAESASSSRPRRSFFFWRRNDRRASCVDREAAEAARAHVSSESTLSGPRTSGEAGDRMCRVDHLGESSRSQEQCGVELIRRRLGRTSP